MEWGYAPVVILEEIFSRCPLSDRFSCSLVCRHWLDVFHSGRVWRRLAIGDRTFTRRKFRQVFPPVATGREDLEINHWQFQVYLGRFGHHTHSIDFRPIANYFNLYEFLRIVSLFLEFFDDYPMPVLEHFSFSFSCESRDRDGDRMVHGTGGQILDEVLRLLGNLRGLRSLAVNHLLLDDAAAAARPLLGSVVENCRHSLQSIQLLNITRLPNVCVLTHVTSLPRLRELTLSLQQLNDASLVNISQHCSTLDTLTLVEDFYTVYYYSRLPEGAIHPLLADTWRQVHTFLPRLQVRLVYRGPADVDVTLQDRHAPVRSIYYDNPWSLVRAESLNSVADRHSTTLEAYGHLGFGRRFRSASFERRADFALVDFVRRCRRLRRLVVRERVSTATLVVLATEGRVLEDLLVRRNSVVLRCDWSRAELASDELLASVRSAARSYDETERAISRILARPWKMLPDHLFKRISI